LLARCVSFVSKRLPVIISIQGLADDKIQLMTRKIKKEI
jgi:hypothetical protein